jgi:hypothetical protein
MFIPDLTFFTPYPHPHQRMLEFLTQKLEIKIRDAHPGPRIPDLDSFLSRAPDPSVKKAPDPDSGSATMIKLLILYGNKFNPNPQQSLSVQNKITLIKLSTCMHVPVPHGLPDNACYT